MASRFEADEIEWEPYHPFSSQMIKQIEVSNGGKNCPPCIKEVRECFARSNWFSLNIISRYQTGVGVWPKFAAI